MAKEYSFLQFRLCQNYFFFTIQIWLLDYYCFYFINSVYCLATGRHNKSIEHHNLDRINIHQAYLFFSPSVLKNFHLSTSNSTGQRNLILPLKEMGKDPSRHRPNLTSRYRVGSSRNRIRIHKKYYCTSPYS